ncbi:prepilin peptidase [Streptomyces sp. Sge12]|uniref:prepilin peptidase n=1 Tax=Streptomyces sp. Sge12 TaxID=1972846 RepID=UPI0009C325D4|nr:A24 family peptidase [Streptomyces sp. Sge12]ARE74817.1 prepilin peptidase [Streptomyces sp. Sge12]
MGVALIVLAAGYGAAAGWLLPRAAYRFSVEPGEPWRDRCPQGHRVRGWLGPARCRVPAEVVVRDPGGRPPGSAAPHAYGRRAAPLAALVGALCALVGAAVGARPEAVAYVGLAPVVVLLSLVDRAVHRLPDVLTLPLAAALAAGLGAAALLPRAGGDWRLALLGGGALGAAYLLLHLINPDGMGFGDVKLALSLGVALGWYGWGVWSAGAFLGLLYGALYGLFLVLRSSERGHQSYAFGPFMAAGALTGVLLGGFGA